MNFYSLPLNGINSKWLSTLPYQNYTTSSLENPLKDIFWNTYIGGTVYYNCNLWAIRFEFLIPILIILINPYISKKYVRWSVLVSVLLLGGIFIEKRWFYFTCMLIGMLLCYYLKDKKILKIKRIVTFYGGICLIIVSFFPHILNSSITLSRLFNISAAIFLIIYIIKYSNKYQQSFLEFKIVKLIGKISYEIYAFHLFFMLTIGAFVSGKLQDIIKYKNSILITYVIVLVITIIFSWIFARWVSHPFTTFINKRL